MKSLGRKGFAKSQGGPAEVLRRPCLRRSSPSCTPRRSSRRSPRSTSVKDLLSERGVPQLVYTIMGRDRVIDKIGEMIDKSENGFVISSPSFPEIRKRLGKRFAAAASRGVKVTVITNPFVKVPKAFQVVRRKALIATDVISDGRNALLAAPDLSACGFTDNEVLSAHLADFLRIMSERQD